MGFNNKGVDYLVDKIKKCKTNIPLGISIGKNWFNRIGLWTVDKVYAYSDYVAINISSQIWEFRICHRKNISMIC